MSSTLGNKITEKSAVNEPGSNAHVLLTQDVTVNGETGQDVRRISMDDLSAAMIPGATLADVKAYLGIS